VIRQRGDSWDSFVTASEEDNQLIGKEYTGIITGSGITSDGPAVFPRSAAIMGTLSL
jgi:hypothetical protein